MPACTHTCVRVYMGPAVLKGLTCGANACMTQAPRSQAESPLKRDSGPRPAVERSHRATRAAACVSDGLGAAAGSGRTQRQSFPARVSGGAPFLPPLPAFPVRVPSQQMCVSPKAARGPALPVKCLLSLVHPRLWVSPSLWLASLDPWFLNLSFWVLSPEWIPRPEVGPENLRFE